ncbi:LysR family transcriptional regulator [Pararobbsia alpina]|uniref:hypothetical protein n=1 Tax=Pararobbsia alpina TaxID=621374 RepID=UPI0039A4EEB0
MTLLVYLVGWLIFTAGVCWALVSMHVAHHAVAVTAVIMVGLGVLTGATRARTRDR